jgi:hypothetical protein
MANKVAAIPANERHPEMLLTGAGIQVVDRMVFQGS